ncbi:MAG: ATP-binding cassette domain-containing protein, partial [Mycobacterium leprae]
MLDVQNLTVKFGGLTAVNEVSLRVAEGQIYGLIGPNGAGKSTCFNLITGLIPPTAGQVLLHGRPLTGLKPHQVTGLGLARTFQNIRLFADMSALENVMVGMHRLT